MAHFGVGAFVAQLFGVALGDHGLALAFPSRRSTEIARAIVLMGRSTVGHRGQLFAGDDFCGVWHFLDPLPEGAAVWKPKLGYAS